MLLLSETLYSCALLDSECTVVGLYVRTNAVRIYI